MIALIGIAGMICAMFWLEGKLGPKHGFAEYRNQIGVLASSFSHRTSAGSNLFVTVIGTLTNHSRIGWKNVNVEAKFFDKSGKLIDVIAADADYGGVTLLPHGEAGFKVEGKAAKQESDYSTHKVQVRWARDVDFWL
jgi:hypothetical protein